MNSSFFLQLLQKRSQTCWSAILPSALCGLCLAIAIANKASAQSQPIQGKVPLVSEIKGDLPSQASNQTLNQVDVQGVIPKPRRLDQMRQPQTDSISQVTSVSELKDVAPTEWAYEALRSLVERYGCIVGYPDRTFRGNRALTRWEFAAGLNACINTMERLLQENVAVLKADIDKLKKLAESFKAELAALGTRVDNLENRVSYLEEHQFSTTTKLSGTAFFYLSNAWRGGNIKAEGKNVFQAFDPPRDPSTNLPNTRLITNNPTTTASYLTWIDFTTSFSGKDSLIVQLAAGNGDAPVNQMLSAGFYNSTGTAFPLQTGGVYPNEVVIRELNYSFPATDNLRFVVGPRINIYRYFDNNRFTFFINGPDSFNSGGSTLFAPIDRGSGAVALWQINDMFSFKATYLGASDEFLPAAIGASAADPSRGWFGGTYTIAAELDIAPTDNINLRFLFNRSRLEPNPFDGYVGGALGEPLPYGLADDGYGGALNHAFANAYIFNFDWLVFDGFGLFGRYSYGSTTTTPVNSAIAKGQINTQSLQLGFSLLDFGKPGAQLNLSYLTPMSVINGRQYLLSGGGDGGVSSEYELNYFYPVTNNIALVPSFYYILKPNNFINNVPIYVANLRAQFSF